MTLEKPKEIFFFLEMPMLIKLKLIAAKQMSNSTFVAHLIALSAKGALIATETEVVAAALPLSHLRINFLSKEGSLTTQDVYARVTQQEESRRYLYVHFTSIPPAIAQHLETIRSAVQDSVTAIHPAPY